MKNIFLIAINTFKEISRHKILYALGAFVVFMMGSSLVLGSLSLSEKTRLSINFSFTACHIGLIFVSVYFASALLSREMEKKTVLTLFVKPVSRTQFIIGKFLSLACVLFLIVLFLTLFVVSVYFIYGRPLHFVVFAAMWGIFLEALMLLTLAFFFSVFSSSFLVLVYSVLMFIIGHSAAGIVFFVQQQGEGDVFSKWVVTGAVRAFPNFEKLNWRAEALYKLPLKEGELLFSSLYAVSWIIFLLMVTSILFERKNLV